MPMKKKSSALREKSSTRDLRITLSIKAKPLEVYRALTSARELCRWWLSGAETDARNGGRVRMVWPAIPEADVFREQEGTFVDLEPEKKVAWIWKTRPGRTGVPPLCSFFILTAKRGCELTLLHAGFSSGPSADKIFQKFALGWEDALAKLKLYLESGKTCKGRCLSFKSLKTVE